MDRVLTLQTGGYSIDLQREEEGFAASLTSSEPENGVMLVRLELKTATPTQPGIYKIIWAYPLVNVQSFWRPGRDRNRALPADWTDSYITQSTNNAPVGCLISQKDENRHTFSFSDGLNPIEIKAGVNEETATFTISLTLFASGAVPIDSYNAYLRLDNRAIPYYQALADAASWWETLPGYLPADTPVLALEPVYSTWYNFHQKLVASEIEEECQIAAQLGCKVVIVDDGWQTDNNERGYAYCGDWEVTPNKIPDMRQLVEAVHKLGMKFVLWYAVPFVGEHSKTFRRFAGRYLGYLENFKTWALDPRYPEVRQYLIEVYEKAMLEWDLDGFKLDFVQHLKQPVTEHPGAPAGRDFSSVAEATDKLLTDILVRLNQIKPETLVEFRQPYIGPLMRKYGNMFRAGDCPNDSLDNHTRILDLRLLSGNSAVHSDMLMWHPNDQVETAAMQFLNVLFSVPQLSVRLKQIPPEQLKMLGFWLSFWREHQSLLLKGALKPHHPGLSFPLVEVTENAETLVAFYTRTIYSVPTSKIDRLYLVNATSEDNIVLEFGNLPGIWQLEVKNCIGEVVLKQEIQPGISLTSIPVPSAGLATLKPIPIENLKM